MMRTLTLWAVCTLALLQSNSSTALTVTELVESIRRHHPAILAAIARTERAGFEQQEAGAAFDTQIKQESYARPSGYYDGLYLEQSVVKPLQFMNAEVFGKYRVSDGDFPVYEADLATLDRGEASLGLKLSLLQNRDTDKRRLQLDKADWKYREAVSKQESALNRLIYAGVQDYLDWYQVHLEYTVIAELVALTEQRMRAVEARHRSGDLPQISVTEYRSTLLSRSISLRQAEQKKLLAGRKLAFYWRDEASTERADDSLSTPPADIGWQYTAARRDPGWVNGVIETHPDVLGLKASIRQTQNDERLARNETLPLLDLEMKLAHDLGDGPASLDQTEGVIALSFSMPLGQRAARARENAARATLRSYRWELQLLESALGRDLDMGLSALEFASDLADLSTEQEQVAQQLLKQEQKRFEQGASDQFVLINREKSAAEARLKRIEATTNVMRRELDLAAAAGQLQ